MMNFQCLYQCTSITKYRDFQYRLLLKKVVTNATLVEWKVTDNSNCTFCQAHPETEEHLFCSCRYVNALWSWLVEHCDIDVNRFTFTNILNITITAEVKHTVNFIGMVILQYLYRMRCAKKILPWKES